MFGKSTLVIVAFSLVVSAASAQTYPFKPVTVIVPYAAGGPLDVYGRALAPAMGKQLKQSVIIENAAGAGGNIGVARAARSIPDGYTILYHNIAMATNPALYRKLDYNPVTDFETIGQVSTSQSVMIARSDLPVSDFKDFVAYARANTDKVTLADAGIGGPSNLCALLFMSMIGTRFTLVSYKGTAPALNDLLGQRVDLLCDASSTAAPHIRSGKVKVFGVTGRTRFPALPGVPTLEEWGLKGFDMVTWTALYAPKNTPKLAIDRLAQALQASLAEAELIAFFDKLGVQPASRDLASPAVLQAHLRSEIDKWGSILKKAGASVD